MKKWEQDKWKHFLIGVPLGFGLLYGSRFAVPENLFLSGFLAISLLVFICFMFEIFSLISDLGFYELMDAIAGVMGGILGMIILYIFISFT